MTVIEEFFDENVDDSYFHSTVALDIEKNLFTKNLTRMYDYFKSNNATIIDSKGGSFDYNHNGQTIETKYDMIIEYPDRIEVVKIANTIPKLSYNAKSEKNLPSNNLELFLLSEGGKSAFNSGGTLFDNISLGITDKPVYGSFYHLQGKADKDSDKKSKIVKNCYQMWLKGDFKGIQHELNELQELYYYYHELGKNGKAKPFMTKINKINSILKFDHNHGNHIISEVKFDKYNILSELDDILSVELNMDSDKCSGTHCTMCPSKVLCDAKKYTHIDLEEIVDEIEDADDWTKLLDDNYELIEKVEIKPTNQQQAVIDTKEGFIRVNSACGTGKSETTAQRFKSLIQDGVESNKILGITFTNKGGQELRDRVSKRANVDKNDLEIYTFNSLGSHILNNEFELLGFTKEPTIVDNITKVETMLSILRNPKYYSIDWLNMKLPLLSMINAKGAVYELFAAFSKKKTFDTFGDYDKEQLEIIQEMFDEYNKAVWSKDKIDYQDQILLVNELFENHPQLIEKYGFTHIMTDEFQDTNKMQVYLLNQLSTYTEFVSMMNVGDASQSIYSFAGSSQEYMLNFEAYFGEFTDLSMTTNFRSTTQICDFANKLDRLNTIRIDKTMTSFKGNGEEVELLSYDTLEDEYRDVANLIKFSDTNYQDTAILARTKAELLKMQRVLSDNNIPSIIDVTERNIDNHTVRLAINLAQYLNNPKENQYLLDHISYLNPEVSSDDELNNLMDSVGKTLTDVINNIITEEERLEEGLDANESIELTRLELYLDLVRPLRDSDEVCDKFIEGVLNSRTFISISDLSSYLKKHVDYNDAGQVEKDERKWKAVKLTTLHSSKGQEFNTTFVLLDKMKYDHKMSLKDLEEERRLLFVGCTRSKDKLYIMYNKNMDKKRGAGKYCLFADEVAMILQD
jgi:DNA helicase-2/ATP-dependent DNA helicase PcrA